MNNAGKNLRYYPVKSGSRNIVHVLAVTQPVQKYISGRVIGDTKEDFQLYAQPVKSYFMYDRVALPLQNTVVWNVLVTG